MTGIKRYEQLQAVSNPSILGLFEDWLDELEEEVLTCVHKGTTKELALQLSLSLAGADFLLKKLNSENRI